MSWTIEPKLKQLDNKIDATQQALNENIKKEKDFILSAITMIKSDVQKDLIEHLNDFKKMNSDLILFGNQLKSNIKETLELQNQQNNQRDKQLYNAIESLNSRINLVQFDIIDNNDNISITYTNPNGKIEYAAVKKIIPDEQTLTLTKDNKLTLKQGFNAKGFDIKNNLISPTALKLNSGSYLTGDDINNNLNSTSYNIKNISCKIEQILKKINNINGYVASNNFRKEIPTQGQLTEFACKCLSTSDFTATPDLIPNSTKIKNTFNNHIWILNRVSTEGLTTMKWEDFGSDNICVASNDGVHGLVTGSQERYRGHIDLNGVISINGLEEDLNEILTSIKNINTNLIKISNDFSAKLDSIENKIKQLES